MRSIHGTCALVGAAGVLITGPSGAGKTDFALALIEDRLRAGRFACLVADDRVGIANRNGRLIAHAPAAIAGLCELRGRGLVRMPFEWEAVVRLNVDIVEPEDQERMLEEGAGTAVIEHVEIPRQPVARGAPNAVRLVLAALANPVGQP